MPPKDHTNLIDGTLYFADENGEFKPFCKISEVSEVEITQDMDAEVLGDGWFQFANALTTDTDLEDIIPEEYRLPTAHEFSFSLGNSPQFTITLYKLMHINNYRRLHGLKPVRHKVWRHNPFAAKRMGKLFRREG